MVRALLLILIFAFSTFAAELSEPIPVEVPMYFTVKGTVRMYDGQIFPWSIVSVLDGQQNVLYVLQVDGDGNFVFPALSGETYIVRGAQTGYAYAPAEINLSNVNSDVSGLLLYAGPDSWFPPQCIIPKDGGTWMQNAPCFVDVRATATDENGQSLASAPQRIYFQPVINPSPSPTRFLNGYVKADGNYFSGSAVVTANGQSFTTQPGGYFELYSVPLGSTLTASAAGYVFPSVTIDSSEYFILDGTALPSPSPTPTATPTPSPTATPTPTPTPSPSPSPSPKPSPTPRCIKWNPNGKCIKWA